MTVSLRKNKDAALLLAVVLVTFSIRFIFYNNGYLYGVDPYYHFNNIKNLVELGDSLFPLSLYSPAIFLYSILKFFNISLYDSFRLTSPIFGCLTVITVFFLAREFLNRKLAFLSAISLALIPAFITRTFAANYRGDIFSMFFYTLGFLFFIKAVKLHAGKPGGKRVYLLAAAATLAGISFAFSAFVWSVGYIFSMVILSVFLIAVSILAFIEPGKTGDPGAVGERVIRGTLVSYAVITGLGVILIYIFNHFELGRSPTGFSDFYRYVFPLSLGFSFILALMSSKLRDWTARKKAYLAAASLLAAVVVMSTFLDGTIERILGIYGKIESYKMSRPTAELGSVDKDMLFERFSIFTLLVPAGLFLMLKEFSKQKRMEQILLFVWFFSGLFIIYQVGQRGIFSSSIPFAIIGAYVFAYVFRVLKSRKRPAHQISAISITSILPILSILSILFVAYGGVNFATEQRPLINDNWNKSLSWLMENTPENAVVISWWDYGYWIRTIGGRRDVINPGYRGKGINDIALLFLEKNESNAILTAKRYKAEYILIPTEMLAQMHNIETILNLSNAHYTIYPYKGSRTIFGRPADIYSSIIVLNTEGGKIAIYSRDGENFAFRNVYYRENGELVHREYTKSDLPFIEGSVYISRGETWLPMTDIRDYAVYIPPLLEDTLLTSLMLLGGEGFSKFVPVYTSPQINIYEIRYPYTKIGVLKSGKKTYRAGTSVTVSGGIRSTRPFSGTMRTWVYMPDGAVLFQNSSAVTWATGESQELQKTGSKAVSNESNKTAKKAAKSSNRSNRSGFTYKFFLPGDAPEGRYRIYTALFDDKNKRVDAYSSYFRVDESGGRIINAGLAEGSSTRNITISGRVEGQVDEVFDKVFLSWGSEVHTAQVAGDGSFEFVIDNPRLFRGTKAYSLHTPDYSASKTIYVTVTAGMVEDLRLSKTKVTRGEDVKASFVVKNTGNIGLEGYLSINPKGSAKKKIFTDDFNIPYKIAPGETARFEHTFTVSGDAPTGKFKIWSEMRENNLKIWVAPRNEDGEGNTAWIEIQT